MREPDPVAGFEHLVGAEVLKLRTVRLPLWLLLATLALVALSVTATVLTAGLDGSPLALEDPDLLARAAAGASGGNVVLLVLGILLITQEFRFGTAGSTFLLTPRRGRVLAAKGVAVVLVGAVIAVVGALLAVGLGALLVLLRGQEPRVDGTLAQVLLGVVLVLVLYGPIGLAVGALVRNQVAAVTAALAWSFVLEQLLVALVPEVGRWLPGGATAAVLQVGELATTRGELLPPWAGALVLLGYAVVLAVLAARITLRRDLT